MLYFLVFCLSLLKSIGLAIIALVAIVAATACVSLYSVSSVALNESFWLNALDEAKFFGLASEQATDLLSQQFGVSTGFAITVPKEWIKQQAQVVIPAFFKYFRGETQTVNAEISLRELKLQLIDSLIAEAKEQLDQLGLPVQIPDCLPAQKFSVSTTTSLPNCWPTTPEQKAAALDSLTATGGEQAAQFPDKINIQDIIDEAQKSSNDPNPLEQIKEMVRTVSLATMILAIVFVALLAIIFFASRSFFWIGGTILASGIASGIVGMLLSVFFAKQIIPQELGLFESVLTALLQKFLSAIQSTILLFAGAMLVAGIILIAIGFYQKKVKEKQTATASN